MAGSSGVPELRIPRLYGLDLKTNVVDVKNGFSLDLQNCIQNSIGVVAKRSGGESMFASDETGAIKIDEIGACTLAGTKYYFQFSNGGFQFSTTLTGTKTYLTTAGLTPNTAISTVNPIWWAVMDDKLFFVDGTNKLRFFNGTALGTSTIHERPTDVATSASGAGAFSYTYTIDNGLGESPACASLASIVSAATIHIVSNVGPFVLVAGDIVRIYSQPDAITGALTLVATHTWTAGDVSTGSADIVTVAISDNAAQLYTERGEAINKSAITALDGITAHYGRLIGWIGSEVAVSKSSNPNSWPDDASAHEAFQYLFGDGDGEDIQACISYREALVVLKKTKVAQFGGVGPDDTGGNAFTFQRIETNGVGCVAGKSARVIGDESVSYLVYLSNHGFMSLGPNGHSRIGENIETQIFGITPSTLAASVSFHHKKAGLYFCSVGADAARKIWVLDVKKDEGVLVGWFKFLSLDIRCAFWDDDNQLYMFGTSTGYSASEKTSGTSTDFSDIQVEFVAAASVNTGADTLTVTNSYQTADPVKIRTNGTIPAGITANTIYYAIRVSATVIKLATTAALASAGTAIDITTQGVGTHSVVSTVAIDAYYTTNWINFGSKSQTKKLMKPSVILNGVATTVVIIMTCAYDWLDRFDDSHTITVGSADPFGAEPFGSFIFGEGSVAAPKNVSIARRKVRAIRYKFRNATINQDLQLQGFEQAFYMLRNRGSAT